MLGLELVFLHSLELWRLMLVHGIVHEGCSCLSSLALLVVLVHAQLHQVVLS